MNEKSKKDSSKYLTSRLEAPHGKKNAANLSNCQNKRSKFWVRKMHFNSKQAQRIHQRGQNFVALGKYKNKETRLQWQTNEREWLDEEN